MKKLFRLSIHRVAPASRQGFTLVELLISLAITTIIVAAIYTSFLGQQKTYTVQDQIAETQQNIRAALMVMAREIMMAGYDPMDTGRFGIDITTYARPGSTLIFTVDKNGNGTKDADETVTYSLFDTPDTPVSERDGILDLVRNVGSGHELVAESITAMAFAYAFDNDGDGRLDDTNGQTTWAVDTDNDGRLDTYLDTNDDGLINQDDTAGGLSLSNTVPIISIRAVRVWLLARTRNARGFTDTTTYVVGPMHIGPDDYEVNSRHRLLTTTILCRNM